MKENELGQHQLTAFTPNANVVPMRGQAIPVNTSFRRPTTIIEGGITAYFHYNAAHERVRMRVLQGENEIFTRFYLGRQYEQDVQANIERLYLGGDAYSAPAV